MTKKRPPQPSLSLKLQHHLRRSSSKILISWCVIFCLLGYLRFHSQFKLRSPIPARRICHSFGHNHSERFSKIAFLFLARRNLPLDFFWSTFFKNGDAKRFSIYIHSKPGFIFNETTSSEVFFGRQISNSVQVVWGESSMIEAEKLLFKAALQDKANQRFALLSDRCVPLYNFSYTYSYLMSSPRSFVDSFVNNKERRYSPEMSPTIPRDKWRKGSQWITLVRRHAKVVADDDVVFPVFKKHCTRWPPFPIDVIGQRKVLQMQQIFDPQLDFQEIGLLRNFKWPRNCIPDEHYVQTLLTMKGLEGELERRTLTYTLWNESATSWHPFIFKYSDAALQKINQIKAINYVYYKSEDRKEWCNVRDRFHGCYLFARKFTRGAAMRLLTEGLVGPFDPIALSHTP